MNITNTSSFCACDSWRNSQQILSSIGILVSGLSVAIYVINISVIIYSNQDSVRKALSVSVCIAALFASAVLVPLTLIQMTLNVESKTVTVCLLLEAIQLTALTEFITTFAIFFILPVVIMSNPLRQTFLQSAKGKCLVVGGSWLFGAMVVVLPGCVMLGTMENHHVSCCGWYLFPDGYIFVLIYGVLIPEVLVAFFCSSRFVYLARQKARETTNPVPLGGQRDQKAETASRRRRSRQVRWLAIAMFHFFVSSAPPCLSCFVYLHCPDCVHSELMLYIMNFFGTTGLILISLASYSFEESRETFKRLYLRCEWRRIRVCDG